MRALPSQRFRHRQGVAAFVAEDQAAIGPGVEDVAQLFRRHDLRHVEAAGLFGGFHRDGAQALQLDAVALGVPRHRQADAAGAQLDGLLDHRLQARALDHRDDQFEIRPLLPGPREAPRRQGDAPPVNGRDDRPPLAVLGVEQQDLVADAPAHDVAQIVGLVAAQRDGHAILKLAWNEQSDHAALVCWI